LEDRLRQRGGELDQLKAELEKQIAARGALERQLSQQLETSREAAAKAASAYKQEATRRRRFEDELAKLRKAKPAAGGKTKSAASTKRIEELEAKAQQSTAELERVKTELDKQMAERTRLESEYQNFSKSSDSLDRQLSKLCEGGGTIEGRVRDSISALARVTAELEKARGDRRRLEERVSFLSTQLQNLHEELRRHLEVEK